MKKPSSIGVYIPTIEGRPGLRRTLHSISQQRLIAGDEVLVLGDGPCPTAETLVSEFGQPFHYVTVQQSKTWGHAQANEALHGGHFKADLLVAQDDDDIFLPRAFEVIREAAQALPNKLLSFHTFSKVYDALTHKDGIGITPLNGYWDGHSIVVPNDPPRLGWWGHEYSGDQSYIFSTFTKWGADRSHVHPAVLTMIRPEQRWRLWYWEVRTPEQVEALRHLRNSCREFMTHDTAEISPKQQTKWWRKVHNAKGIKAFLFTSGFDTDYLGFALLRRKGKRFLTTYGLRPDDRGKGYGKELMELGLLACQGPALCDMREDNTVVRAISKKLGWIEDDTRGSLVYAHHPWIVEA